MYVSKALLTFLYGTVQFSLSVVSDSVTPWTAACQASLSITNSQSLSNVHWVSDIIQPSHPLLSPSPPVFNLSQHQGLFQWVSSSHQVGTVLELQPQHQSFQWIFRTDSFRIDWSDLLAVQGILKSLLQQNSSKASILWCSAFFMVQLSHPYMTTCTVDFNIITFFFRVKFSGHGQ